MKHMTQNDYSFLQKKSESSSEEDKKKTEMIKPSVFYKGSHLTTEKSDTLATVAVQTSRSVKVSVSSDIDVAETPKRRHKGAKK